jgi:hypothetical protein
MKVDSKIPVATQIEGALMKKGLDNTKAEGRAALKLLDAIKPIPNAPLASGPIGTKINLGI